jgi:hypothetical protein
MRKIIWRMICVLGFLCYGVGAQAITVPSGFNTVIVPVAGQSPDDLHAALVNAFSQTLIKISGNSRIASIPAVQQQFPTVEKFVQKYSYLDGSVQVTFDQRALITLLAQAQQPVWLGVRPLTLVLLSVNAQPPLMASANPVDPAVAVVQTSAADRGLPILFPTDSDNQQAPAADPQSLEKIAAHYQASAVLYGELQQNPDQSWMINWLLVWHGQTWQWHDAGLEPSLLQAGVEKTADTIAGEAAVKLSQLSENRVWLAVLGVNRLADLQAVLQALKQCQPVLNVFVQDVGSQGVLLLVTLTGEDDQAFKAALASNPRFTPMEGTPANGVLSYQWKP